MSLKIAVNNRPSTCVTHVRIDGFFAGGNRIFWRQQPSGSGSGGGAKWLCLQEFGMFGNIYQIFLYSSPDGLAWKLENDGNPVQGLQPAPGSPVSRVRTCICERRGRAPAAGARWTIQFVVPRDERDGSDAI